MWMRAAVVVLGVALAGRVWANEPMGPVLPAASEFRVTLAEAKAGDVPEGRACSGDAEGTLTCRVFRVTLKNVGTHTVWLVGDACSDPAVRVEEEEHRAGGVEAWRGIGESRNDCWGTGVDWTAAGMWKNVRLRPGEATSFVARLLEPRFQNGEVRATGGMFEPGVQTVRAVWTMVGCTEQVEGKSCLEAMESEHVVTPAGTNMGCTGPCVFLQPTVDVRSEGIAVRAPAEAKLVPKLEVKLTARMMAADDPLIAKNPSLQGCTAAAAGSLDCVLLHMTVRNASDHGVEIGRMTCSDFSVGPQYKAADGTWKGFDMPMWVCSRNFMEWRPVAAGATIEEDFTLRRLELGFQVDPVRKAGTYAFRVRYAPEVCVAAVDGSFCLTKPKGMEPIVSPEVEVTTTADAVADKTWP